MRVWKVALAVVVVLAALAFAGWWFLLRDDAPPGAALPVRTTPSTAPGAAPSAADGTWTVQPGDEVFAGYRIKEQFAGDTIEKTAVGRSPAVTGTVTVQGTQIPVATFEVDLTKLTSDSGRRDASQQGGGLQIGQFPTAPLRARPARSRCRHRRRSTPRSRCRRRATSRSTASPSRSRSPLKANWTGDLIDVAGSAPIVLSRLRHRAAIGRRLRRGRGGRLVRGAAHASSGPDRQRAPRLSAAALPSARMARRHRVVIVGAGFGGLSATKALAEAPVDVVLVDANNYHLFQPLLYQVATAGLDADDIAYPVRGIFHRQRNVDVVLGRVTGADLERAGAAGRRRRGDRLRQPGAGGRRGHRHLRRPGRRRARLLAEDTSRTRWRCATTCCGGSRRRPGARS